MAFAARVHERRVEHIRASTEIFTEETTASVLENTKALFLFPGATRLKTGRSVALLLAVFAVAALVLLRQAGMPPGRWPALQSVRRAARPLGLTTPAPGRSPPLPRFARWNSMDVAFY